MILICCRVVDLSVRLQSEKLTLTLSSIYTDSNILKKKALGKRCGKR